ncbi:hypothetical protein [Sphingobacterium multivorum]|uniref:hypothetical protein n=2 Tax=Sphingobacteriaceae TaxID=84566 RepID=UPI00096636A4|nr:hypothetical protein [Sphingobacterium multivorum]OJZ11042.1 MAG: hypothetical protein BGP15_15170 [Sphingobacterium sp. 40-24]
MRCGILHKNQSADVNKKSDMLIERDEMVRLSDAISDMLIKEDYRHTDVMGITHEKLIKYSEKIALLYDVDESIRGAFHDEDTLDHFKMLLKFDIAYKTRFQKE